MPKILIAAIIGIAAFAAAYLILSHGEFLSTTLSMTANAVKIFTANLQNATQSTVQNLQQQITQTTTSEMQKTTTTWMTSQISTQTTSQATQQTTSATTSPASSTTSTTATTETSTTNENVCKGHALCANDTVTNVIDGDTIETQKYGTIRLALVNTPEKGEDGYEEATEFTTEYCLNKNVLIDQDGGQPVDQFGRKVAVVYCDWLNINEELYYSGYAEISTQFCSQSAFAHEQWAIDGGCPE